MIYTFLPIKDILEIVFNRKMMRFSGFCKILIVMVFISLAKYHASLDPKNRDITLPTKFHIVKAMVFPVVMYGCESWTIQKAECWRIGAFESSWRKFLKSPLESKEIKPVNPKGNQPWMLMDVLMLKIQYFGHLIQRADSLGKTWMLGEIEGKREYSRGWNG